MNKEDFNFKVLLVEDDKMFRKYLANAVEKLGYDHYEAANGKQGLQLFLETTPHLVISDIQ